MKSLVAGIVILNLVATAVVAAPTAAQKQLATDLASYDNLKGQFAQHQDCLTQFQASHPDAKQVDAQVQALRGIAGQSNDATCKLASAAIQKLIAPMSQALHDCQTQRNTALTKTVESNQAIAQKVIPILAQVFAPEITKDRTGFVNGLIHNDASNIVVDAVNDCKTNFQGDTTRWGNQIRSNKQWYKDHYKLSKY